MTTIVLFESVYAKDPGKRYMKRRRMKRGRNVNEIYEKREEEAAPPPPTGLSGLTDPIQQNLDLINTFFQRGNLVGGLQDTGPRE